MIKLVINLDPIKSKQSTKEKETGFLRGKPYSGKNHGPYRLGQQTTKHYVKKVTRKLTTLPK